MTFGNMKIAASDVNKANPFWEAIRFKMTFISWIHCANQYGKIRREKEERGEVYEPKHFWLDDHNYSVQKTVRSRNSSSFVDYKISNNSIEGPINDYVDEHELDDIVSNGGKWDIQKSPREL